MVYVFPTRQFEAWSIWGAALRRNAAAPVAKSLCEFWKLADAGRSLQRIDRDRCHKAIQCSNAILAPLGEPLDQCTGLSRWLADAREEAYSDWLAWVFAQMTISELAGVLGIPELRSYPDAVIPQREVWVSYNGEWGRIDILARVSNHTLLVIEVKKATGGEAAREQLLRYATYLEEGEFAGLNIIPMLLSSDVQSGDGSAVRYRDHATVCRNLRRFVTRQRPQRIKGCQSVPEGLASLQAATVLLVVDAIETNLLNLRGTERAIADHLEEFTKSNDYECWS